MSRQLWEAKQIHASRTPTDSLGKTERSRGWILFVANRRRRFRALRRGFGTRSRLLGGFRSRFRFPRPHVMSHYPDLAAGQRGGTNSRAIPQAIFALLS